MIIQRYSFVIFMFMALVLLMVGKVNPPALERLRYHSMDTIAPVLDALARPIITVQNIALTIKDYFSLREENNRLRMMVQEGLQWQNTAQNLSIENKELQRLLNFKIDQPSSYISARVIADTGGPYIRSMIVTAGALDGVRNGMAVMADQGLIGRIIETGDWSSRILLITDLNSRIPVTLSPSGDRAILGGDNSSEPELLYLPQDSVASVGSRVVTSGHGGIFPPNIPVGIINHVEPGHITVAPLADLGRINYVRLVDFSLKGGLFNTMTVTPPSVARHKQ